MLEHPIAFSYLTTVIRTVQNQLVRVIFKVSVSETDFSFIASPPYSRARLLPQPGEPVFPGCTGWFGAAASALEHLNIIA